MNRGASVWPRAGAMLAVVTIGGSQVLFGLIAGNREHFPTTVAFHAWTLVWAQILPALLLVALDVGVERLSGPEGRGRRAWRAVLYALLAISFFRQLQVQHPGLFFVGFPAWAAVAAYGAIFAGCATLAMKRGPTADRYVAILGVLALLLTLDYARRVWPSTPSVEIPDTVEKKDGRPVVILLFDELALDVLLKDGAIDRDAFPRLAALAADSAWFPDASTHHSATTHSLRTIMSGRVNGSARGPLLFERLRDTHRVRGLVAWPGQSVWLKTTAGPGDRYVSRTDADSLRLGPLETAEFLGMALGESAFVRDGLTIAHQGREFATPDLWDLWTSRNVLEVEIDSFLSGLTKANAPGRIFYWHCSLPHSPYQYDAAGRRHGREPMFFKPGENPAAVLENYREQVRAVDHVVGRVIDRMKAEGFYDEALLVVTSDHGVRTGGALEPEGFPEVRSGLEPRVPFLIRGPGIRPGVYDADYQHVDFAPTLLEALGRTAEEGAFEGISAFAPRKSPRETSYRSYVLSKERSTRYVLDRATGLWRKR